MSYRIIYLDDYDRVIRGVIMDARAVIPAIADKYGFDVKNYCDSIISIVNSSVLPFRIETEQGNLAGWFTLQTGEIVSIIGKQLRPAFLADDAAISGLINNFITGNDWRQYYLF